MIIQVIAAYFVTIFFSIMFNNARHQLIYCGLAGGLGWLVYLLSLQTSPSVVLASFFGALTVSILAFILSKVRKAPVTVFQIPGIIPLVPGMGMYQTLSAVISKDYDQVSYYLLETLQIAGAIAVAMMLVSAVRSVLEKQTLNKKAS